MGVNGLIPLVNLIKLVEEEQEGQALFSKILKTISGCLNHIDEYDW